MFTPLNFSHCNLQLLHVVAVVAAPAAGPVDGAPCHAGARAQWLPRSPLGRGVLGRGVNREPFWFLAAADSPCQGNCDASLTCATNLGLPS